MSDDEDDPEEKLGDTVRYLQKLGPDHVDVIFEASKWVFEQDKRAGLQVRHFQSPLAAVVCASPFTDGPHCCNVCEIDLRRRFRRSRIITSPRRYGSPRQDRAGLVYQLPRAYHSRSRRARI